MANERIAHAGLAGKRMDDGQAASLIEKGVRFMKKGSGSFIP